MPTIARAGIPLYYDEEGSGPAVLLHTGGGGDGEMFRPAGYVSALVGAGYRVIVFDHRGHGRSGKPDTVDGHRLTEYVDDVVAVLDATGARRAAVLGYSKGMEIALSVAATYPDRVAAVVGIGAVGTAGEPRDWLRESAELTREQGTAAAMKAFADTEAEPPPRWLLDNLSSTDAEQFALQLEAGLEGPELWDHFSRVAVPTLLLCGELEEGEPGVAARNVRSAAELLPDGDAVVVPGLAHLAIFWRTDLTLPPILGFLAERYPPVSRGAGRARG